MEKLPAGRVTIVRISGVPSAASARNRGNGTDGNKHRKITYVTYVVGHLVQTQIVQSHDLNIRTCPL